MNAQQWSILMLVAVTLIYTGASIAYYFSAKPGMVLVFVGYAIANIGLIMETVN